MPNPTNPDQPAADDELKDLLDAHATSYALGTKDFVTDKITEEQLHKQLQKSDRDTLAAIKADRAQAVRAALERVDVQNIKDTITCYDVTRGDDVHIPALKAHAAIAAEKAKVTE